MGAGAVLGCRVDEEPGRRRSGPWARARRCRDGDVGAAARQKEPPEAWAGNKSMPGAADRDAAPSLCQRIDSVKTYNGRYKVHGQYIVFINYDYLHATLGIRLPD